jgi:ankyrin repeat protein
MSNTRGGLHYATSYGEWTLDEATAEFHNLFHIEMEHHMMANYIMTILARRYDGTRVDVNRPIRPFENTPLGIAIHAGNLQVVNVLLKFGANANLCQMYDMHTKSKTTPLHLAVCNNRCGVDMMKSLLQHGASVYAVDGSEKTILHYICQNNREDISIESSTLITKKLEKLDLVLKNIEPNRLHGVLNYKNLQGDIPLHTAISYHRCDIAADLIAAGSDVNLRNNMGYSSLNWAVLNMRDETDHPEVAEFFSSEFVIQYMIQFKADVETKTESGNTPLFTAIHPYHKEGCHYIKPKMWAIKILLQHGASLSNKNANGVSPWSSADITTRDKILEVLHEMKNEPVV